MVVLQPFVPDAVTGAFESTCTWTDAMPAGLEAKPETVTVLDMVAPACGPEIDTDGGALLTVTETDALLDRPTESVAVAVMVCEPSLRVVVSTDWLQLVVPLAVTAAFESTCTVTEAMPAMPDAEPETVTAPETNAPANGDEIETCLLYTSDAADE